MRVVGEEEHCVALNVGSSRGKPLVIRGSSVHRRLEKPEGVQNTESIPGREGWAEKRKVVVSIPTCHYRKWRLREGE